MKHIYNFSKFQLDENIQTDPQIKPISSKVYTQEEMVKNGGNYHLQHGILALIPVNKIDGLDPEPGDWTDDEGNVKSFISGTKIDKPIEVMYDETNDNYILYDGNHRVKQAKTNGDKYIKGFVQAERKSLYSQMLGSD